MNNENRHSFIAIGLCVVFYLLYTQYLNKKYPDYQKPVSSSENAPVENAAEPAQASLSGESAVAASSAPATALQVQLLPAEQLTFDNGDMRLIFDQRQAALISVELLKFHSAVDKSNDHLQLLSGPLALQMVNAPQVASSAALDPGVFAAMRSDSKLTFQRQDGNFAYEMRYQMPASGHVIALETAVKNLQSTAQQMHPAMVLQYAPDLSKSHAKSFWVPGAPTQQPRFVGQFLGSEEFVDLEKLCDPSGDKKVSSPKGPVDFVGFDSHYFLAALIPQEAWEVQAAKAPVAGNCKVQVTLSDALATLNAGEEKVFKTSFYLGPKQLESLAAASPKLRTTLGLGWLDMIAHPLLLAIKGLYNFTGNYGIAIVLLTALLKVLFYPLTRQAAISMAAMKKYNPEMTQIRERYKDNPQHMQRELMRFMAAHKINPMKGCLPILPQIPVFFAFYRVLSASIELRHAPFFLWIKDLSAADPYYVSPLLLGVLMFVQQKLTPMTGVDKTQEKILMALPLVFTVMMLSLPSGLVIYMITNTIISVGQQQWLNKRLNPT